MRHQTPAGSNASPASARLLIHILVLLHLPHRLPVLIIHIWQVGIACNRSVYNGMGTDWARAAMQAGAPPTAVRTASATPHPRRQHTWFKPPVKRLLAIHLIVLLAEPLLLGINLLLFHV